MRIAIAGAGVAGSYLLRLLGERHDVVGFEIQEEGKYRSACAWGASKYPMREFASRAGLSFDDYVLFEGRYFTIKFGELRMDIRLTGMVTFDKERFLADLRKGANVRYGFRASAGSLPDGYDLAVDATGFHRSLLGRPSSDVVIPTVEYMARYDDPPFDDFYAEVLPGLTGFVWFFPLGGKLAHVGAGDLRRGHLEALSAFVDKHRPREVVRRVGRPVRLSTPGMSRPLRAGNVVAAGEAAGVVFPTTGEGIIPSLQSASLLAEVIERGDLESYEERALREFKLHEETGDLFFNRLLRGDRGLATALKLLRLSIEFSGKSRRFGLRPSPLSLARAMLGYAARAL